MSRRTLAVAVLALALLGGGGCGSAPTPTTAADLPPAPATVHVDRPAPRAGPGRLIIPDLDVDVPLVELGVTATGEHEVPATADAVGWYRGGPRPGEPGPALLLGHVDLHDVPGVFAHLDHLQPGDLVQAGTTVFEVYDVRRVPKTQFPDELVYGRTPDPQLRLITCGGAFDHTSGHYRDNVIVSARATPLTARQLDGG